MPAAHPTPPPGEHSNAGPLPIGKHCTALVECARGLGFSVGSAGSVSFRVGSGTVFAQRYTVKPRVLDAVSWIGGTQDAACVVSGSGLQVHTRCDGFETAGAHEHLEGMLTRARTRWRRGTRCLLCQRETGGAEHDCNGFVQVVCQLDSGLSRLALAYTELRVVATTPPAAFKLRLFLCLLGESRVLEWALNFLGMLAAAENEAIPPLKLPPVHTPFPRACGSLKVRPCTRALHARWGRGAWGAR